MSQYRLWCFLIAAALLVGCGDESSSTSDMAGDSDVTDTGDMPPVDVPNPGDMPGEVGDVPGEVGDVPGEVGDMPGDVPGDLPGDTDVSGDLDMVGDADMADTNDMMDMTDPCAMLMCAADQHCEVDAMGVAACMNNTCMMLACGATERCEPTMGGGAVCVDISCTVDTQCAGNEYCNGTICVADVCVAGETSCMGADLYTCNANGSGSTVTYTCGSMTSFTSMCVDTGNGAASCSCGDDWDCPANTECEAGSCAGTGQAPTCFLPPEPFTNVLPTPEITWGGTYPNPLASNSPFETSVQSVISPVVVNLDDDNGDGLINENDFPEILFLTFCNSEFTSNGVLRAIHGGGPNKGQDFFASCGNTLWKEGDSLPATCACGSAFIDSTASLAAGDLDYDGVPEIVAIHEGDGILIYNNVGELLVDFDTPSLIGPNPAPSIANIDGQGFAEIVVGHSVFTLGLDMAGDLQILDRFVGDQTTGRNGQGPASCVADLLGDDRLEIVGGAAVYRFPNAPAGAVTRADCTGGETDPDEVAWCAGDLIVEWDEDRDGFCAVVDVLGVDQTLPPGPTNPLDGVPEVVLVSAGRLRIYNGQTGTERINVASSGTRGGAPNVDDFDGDGFPEVGTAGNNAYVMLDLQAPTASCPAWPTVLQDGQPPPMSNPARTLNGNTCTTDVDCGGGTEAVCNTEIGECVCLHNGWRRASEDGSQVTGSTLFDFNGDRAAEVVYNDECWFRIYNGLDGEVLFKEASESRTRIEFPIVADVDNDGNAEIVFATTTESGHCSERNQSDGMGGNWRDHYNAGIEVWGDAGDYWVSARRVWNQHSYHVTNVTEGGGVPLVEPESWVAWNGRYYNTYRSQPRSAGVAPDLVVDRVQLVAAGGSCGQLGSQVDIIAQISNIGDVRVGPGVVVQFEGTWAMPALVESLNDNMGAPLSFVLGTSLEPGASLQVIVSYDAANNTPMVLPDTIRVIVDAGAQERECNELNNDASQPVMGGSPEADLRVTIAQPDDTNCPVSISVATTVYNDGSVDASNIIVRYYAGDPAQGGIPLHDETIAGPIPAGGMFVLNPQFAITPNLDITIYAEVDPNNDISECNDGNNTSSAAAPVRCALN